MSTLQRQKLAAIQFVPNAVAAVYTNAVGKITLISGVTLHNDNTTAETVKLYNVPAVAGAAGTAAVGNKFLELSLAPKDTLEYEFGSPRILDGTNDTLQAVTTTASKVTIEIGGDRVA